MKEAYFKGIRWTKIFVTGPLDPAHNQYKCTAESVRATSQSTPRAREIIRHYQSDSHLRKDQLWRFTYLKKVNEITKVVTHQVRGRNGLLLTPLELEKEKPFFENAQLVDIGEEFPFTRNTLLDKKGDKPLETLGIAPKSLWSETMVPFSGDIRMLQALWTQVGIHMNYQDAFPAFRLGVH